ncbi:13548_t:CDS:2, partial [Dentiscutata erythropus]
QSMRDICDEVIDLSKTFKEQKKQICNSIIKKYKKNNLDFPPSSQDWVIRKMMVSYVQCA